MTIFANDFPGTRIELFKKMLAEEQVKAAAIAKKIRINMSRRMIQIDPSAIHLFGSTASKERIARMLFRGQEPSMIS